MSLPPGWISAPLLDVVALHDSRRVPLNQAQRSSMPGSYPYFGANGQVDTVGDYLFDGDYILLAEDGGYFDDPRRGVAYRAGGKFWVNNHAHILRSERGVLESYLCPVLNSLDWMEFVSGTTRLKLTQGGMQRVQIPLPPAAEQRRIVARLDALTARLARARAEAERSVELARRLRDQIQARGIGAGTILLSELLSAPLRNGLSIKGTDSPPGIPALKLSALRGQSVDLHDVRYLDVETLRAENYRLECDDVLVARGNGTLRLVGRASRVAVAPNDLTIFPDTAFRIRLNPSRASARWFTLIWNSPLVRAQIEARARTTAGIWKISQRDLNEIELPDVARGDQVEWVASVEAAFARADRLEAEAKKALALIYRLEAEILAKAFRGELVAQDPNDEPASVLLERIRALRAAEPKVKRGRRPKMAS